MQSLPHIYSTQVTGAAGGDLRLSAPGLPDLMCNAPAQFDGPGNQWSPESLLMAAAASCFALTFRAIARASMLEWLHLECANHGTLERSGKGLQFTRIVTHVHLTVPVATSIEACQRTLEKAERDCLVTNSLRVERELKLETLTRCESAFAEAGRPHS